MELGILQAAAVAPVRGRGNVEHTERESTATRGGDVRARPNERVTHTTAIKPPAVAEIRPRAARDHRRDHAKLRARSGADVAAGGATKA